MSVAPSANEVLSSKGRSFYWARHFLGSRHAERATRLYAFCRYLDDLADESPSPDEARSKLKAVREDVLRGESADASLSDGLSLARECGISKEPILELINGIASDLEEVRIADVDELIRYCYRVAGTVGLMMCRVLDVSSPAAYPHAVDLGIAMQLTNICRDVLEDAAMGRRYLPSTLVGDLSPLELINPNTAVCAKIASGALELLQLSEDYYRSGEEGLSYLPLRARGAILIASRVYHGIGLDLISRKGDCWSRRAMVSSAQKALITVKALTSVTQGRSSKRSFWSATCAHRSELHIALAGLEIAP
ncbi:MAG: phytoene/squalene synthase family protein [Verrucomicrobia bacterium]|nr:phytoene/squalene synthase family protein [Verrucomicrobiota bacterium]